MIWERYADYLPEMEEPVSLGEGGTPLIPSRSIGPSLGFQSLYLKFEGANPTGSFKDRGMTVAVSQARQQGARAVVCASTGNTAASAAAYAARAGLEAVVLVPEGQVAGGKLIQTLAAGACVLGLPAGFDRALELARKLAERDEAVLVNSVNPDRLLGQATLAYEMLDALGDQLRVIALPVGNAGNISALWQGITRYGRGSPRLLGVQAEGASPIVQGRPVKEPQTVASAIRIGHPAGWQTALQALEESEGRILAVSDEEILSAYRRLAREEGIFCEPASAAGLAGIMRLAGEGWLDPGATTVCVLTGHGLKDLETATSLGRLESLGAAEEEAVTKALGWR